MIQNKIALISGCDSNYFPLLKEWLHSVQRFPQSKQLDICIMDAGLTQAQCAGIEPHVTRIVRPDWPCDIEEQKIKGREFLKACVCRPFLPEIFPG